MFSHDKRELAAVFIGGALGTLARAGLAELGAPHPSQWPWPTFVVNIVGAFLLGYFSTRLLERLPLSSYRRPMWGTGLCGGLTTFSTFGFESFSLANDRQYVLASANILACVVVGLAAVWLGYRLAERWPGV